MAQAYRKQSFNSPATLQVSDLECVRGYASLFSGLNLDVTSGTALHIVGENGVGKTSLLRILAGLSQSEHGIVRWNGHDISEDQLEYHSAMTYLGHKTGLKDSLTAQENLTFLGQLEDTVSDISVIDSLQIMDMENSLNSPVLQLSAGQRQRLALARVMRSNAQLWLLDEPATALDRSGTNLLENAMGVHNAAGGSIIYTSHQKLDLDENSHQQYRLS